MKKYKDKKKEMLDNFVKEIELEKDLSTTELERV
jgi:hypothetical protein